MPTRTKVQPCVGWYVSEMFQTSGSGLPKTAAINDNYSRQTSDSSYTPTSLANQRTIFTQSFTSVSTPGYYIKKRDVIKWVPKKYPLKPPVRPRFNPPALPLRSSFKTNPNGQRRFLKAYAKQEKKRVLYISNYNKAFQKFLKREAKYKQLLELQAKGIVKYRRVRSTEKSYTRNPYSSSITIDHGVVGTARERFTSSTPYWITPVKNGAYCRLRYSALYNGTPYTNVFGATSLTTSCLKNAESRASRKLFEKLNEQKVHIGNIVAERLQTYALLAEILGRLVSFFTNPANLIRYFGSGLTKRVGNDFLAFKFGVEPLLNDAYSASEALRKSLSTKTGDSIIVRVGHSASDQQLSTSKNANGGVTTIWLTERVSVHYAMEYKVVNAAASSLQQLGLLNPVEIAWEAMPWSFVIDWFLPIGNYIQSLNADAGLAFVGGTKTVVTTRQEITRFQQPRFYFGTSGSQWSESSYQGGQTKVTKVRSVLSGPPSPLFPQFKSPLSVTHVLEALALLRQKHP